ncbi:MAG: type I restriction enzyme HsdR N-terminal domain-containing protein [Flavobacteriales bacterium]|jgi:hypothetical protein|nr:type I restriction enzyme HsdR N-terminal domain-containing protein [Flavobacteriales bacterium]MBK9512068.1 type I restriction enzyme HsdR N-terminal domain-containing protein [Flavobacteriales bacterium]MBP7448494.1 type I restriction enzyme HsdR N-terminal domain-containing protein [Flavobacteriales bacterium]HOZ39914.1 type I restriction enzyme HsdR N-terminal domain-containing protein [Flavobacteriales bacterium]
MGTGFHVLSLPDHGIKTKHDAAGLQVFDPIRRKWVALSPEEWVRQHFVNHLVHDLGYPAGRTLVEHGLIYNGRSQRADVVICDGSGGPLVLVECKAPSVAISQRTFEQAARYNTVFKVPFLMVTNGLKHYCCRVDHRTGDVDFLTALPTYEELLPRVAG